jgi:hypothetical protein
MSRRLGENQFAHCLSHLDLADVAVDGFAA